MEITFDPAKDASNIERRGLSLALAGDIDWGFAYEWQDERKDYGEVRMVALAPIGDRLFCAAYVDRNLRGKPRGSARGSSEQAGTACGATSVASGQLACEVQQGQPHQPLPTAIPLGEWIVAPVSHRGISTACQFVF